MKISVKKSLLTVAVSSILVSPVVNATNGYFMHGASTKEKGMAGAGVAFSQDALASATNPAGMAFVGERLDIGLAVFSPSPRSYTVTGTRIDPPPNTPGLNTFINAEIGTEYESDGDFFFMPNIGYNWQIDETTTVGVAIYGNGGMNTNYKAENTPNPAPGVTGTFGDGTAGINLEQAFFNLSIANKLSDKHAIGVSILLVGQKFSAEGLSNFGNMSVDADNLSSGKNDTATGVGLKFGYQGEVSDGVRLGVSYQSKVKMSDFDKYAGLFVNGGNFDTPVTYTIGIAIDVGSSGVIVADVQEIKYSGVASISNSLMPAMGMCMQNVDRASNCLGGTNGPAFGWEDMTVFKIGYQLDMDNNTFRMGYSHADQPIPESQVFFNVLAPAVIEEHITLGWTMRVGDNQEFNVSGMYAPSNSVKGANPFDDGSTQIEIEMSQWEIQAGWAWRY